MPYRTLTESELDAVNKILLETAVDLTAKLRAELGLPAAVMITGCFPKDQRHAFSGFPSEEAGREVIKRLVRNWAKSAH